MLLTSRSPKIKRAAKLLQRKYRNQEKQFLVEGPQAVRELLTHVPQKVLEIFTTSEFKSKNSDVTKLAAAQGLEVYEIEDAGIKALSDTVNPQGIVALAETLEGDLKSSLKDAKLVVVLFEIRDPGNAGTILRSADAVGADLVVFAGDSIDPWHPKVVRSTTGSLFHLPVVQERDLEDALTEIEASGVVTVAADVRGKELSPHDQILKERIAWVFGNEARGLTKEQRDLCAGVSKLPIYGRAESLNIATAAAVCLYTTAFAQRNA